jgi:hypothetical protein
MPLRLALIAVPPSFCSPPSTARTPRARALVAAVVLARADGQGARPGGAAVASERVGKAMRNRPGGTRVSVKAGSMACHQGGRQSD